MAERSAQPALAVSYATIPGLLAGAVLPHALHREPRVWLETNCYADLWIELLGALALEPYAMLSHTLRVDFEGDQWTFFKPGADDLRLLYGIEIAELAIWDGGERHLIEQLSRGRIVLWEVDAYYLPDTAGISHHQAHTKTTIGVERIDPGAKRLGYFHNAGYHTLEADDFDGLLSKTAALPLYAELVKLDRLERLGDRELRRRARRLFLRDVARRPPQNPILEYQRDFARHAGWLAGGELEVFHRYAFASLRQCGAAYELAASHLRWLFTDNPVALAAADDFDAIAVAAKAETLKLARAVQRNRAAELGPLLDAAPRWDRAFSALVEGAAELGREAA